MYSNDAVTLTGVKKNIDEWVANGQPSLDNLMFLTLNLKLTTSENSDVDGCTQAWDFRRAVIENMVTGKWVMVPATFSRYVADGFKKVLAPEEIQVEKEKYAKFVNMLCGDNGVTSPYVNNKDILLRWIQSDNGLDNILDVARAWNSILTWINTNAESITGYYGSVSFNTANNGDSTLILGKTKQDITRIIFDN
jgi:hypothetical protein